MEPLILILNLVQNLMNHKKLTEVEELGVVEEEEITEVEVVVGMALAHALPVRFVLCSAMMLLTVGADLMRILCNRILHLLL